MIRRRIPIPAVGMLGAFLGFVVLLLLGSLALDYLSRVAETRRVSQALLAQVNGAVRAELRRVGGAVESLLTTADQFFASGLLDPREVGSTNAFLMGFMEIHPFVTSVNYGDAAGKGYLLLRQGGIWRNRLRDPAEPGTVRWVELNERGRPRDEAVAVDDYDPRDRPWYRNAAGRQGVQWTPPYLFRTTRDPGVTASLALGRGGSGRGAVLGVDLMLKDLSGFLAGVPRPWPGAEIHVLTEEGSVVASSDQEAFAAALGGSGGALPTVSAPGFEALRAAWEALEGDPAGFLDVAAGGTRYFATVGAFGFEGAAGRTRTVLTVPRRSVLRTYEIESLGKASLFLVFLGAAAALFTWRYLLPLRRVTRAVGEMAEGRELLEGVDQGRGDEIGTLARAFRRTVERLREQREALQGSERRYRRLFEDNPHPMWVHDAGTGRFLAVNRVAAAHYGYTREEFLALAVTDLVASGGAVPAPAETQPPEPAACFHRRKDGSSLQVELSANPIAWEGREAVVVLVHDVTERTRLERELRHSQKMDTIGRLAGGVAHDFNNLLTVITGQCELLLLDPEAGHPLRGGLERIRAAGDRAAELTRQLLAFGRRQLLRPRVVDLNDMVRETEKLLHRVIGEDVELAVSQAPDLWPVRVDPGQMVQVVMNLVLNARDAMPGGGRVCLFTENVVVAPQAPKGTDRGQAEVPPGAYVLLRVVDTGAGMAPETLARIFEPFFTTKGMGRGTGLGLSTVYGIVEQSGGFVRVSSELGRGAEFRVYLPRADGSPEGGSAPGPAEDAPRGSETVLLAEDEEGVRRMARDLLKGCGYRVLEAADGDEALRVAAAYPGPIHLLLTDVVMPAMGGGELAARLAIDRPGVRVLFMSGYADDAVLRQGVQEGGFGFGFVHKPFSRSVLAGRVREAIDGPKRAGNNPLSGGR